MIIVQQIKLQSREMHFFQKKYAIGVGVVSLYIFQRSNCELCLFTNIRGDGG